MTTLWPRQNRGSQTSVSLVLPGVGGIRSVKTAFQTLQASRWQRPPFDHCEEKIKFSGMIRWSPWIKRSGLHARRLPVVLVWHSHGSRGSYTSFWMALPSALSAPQPVMMTQEISEWSSRNTGLAGLSWNNFQAFSRYHISSWFQTCLRHWTPLPGSAPRCRREFRPEYEYLKGAVGRNKERTSLSLVASCCEMRTYM